MREPVLEAAGWTFWNGRWGAEDSPRSPGRQATYETSWGECAVSAPGLLQVVGAPLRPGDRLAGGAALRGGELRIRIHAPRRIVEAMFRLPHTARPRSTLSFHVRGSRPSAEIDGQLPRPAWSRVLR
jgi:hypothetical protein